ncbi:hypothetical protein EDC96DRAFT_542656 [Choanephora cucurbitarum]|nr:hypothetical protein EDC96DRAFT_542656 [Choanephora cucurbitarum]
MLASLELFFSSNTLPLSTKVFERDLIRLFSSCLLNCCIGSDIVVSTEKQRLSLIISNNLNRSVASLPGLAKQAPVQLLDICFSYANYEFGFCEAERYNKGDCATKRLLESKVKLPSMMKKAFSRLLQRVNQKRSASVISFYVSELEIEALRMCSPCGFVCLITRSLIYTFPATLSLFKKDMQKLIIVVLNMKNEMLRSIKSVIEEAVKELKFDYL